MNGEIINSLRKKLRDPEYSEGYAESFLNAYIATQIKVLREQRVKTQAELAEQIGTTQAGISRLENVNYSSWSIRTLIKLARAFNVRLHVSFEPYGTLPNEVVNFSRESLERVKREDDQGLSERLVPIHEKSLAPRVSIANIEDWKVLRQGGQEVRKRSQVATRGPNESDALGYTQLLSQVVTENQQHFDTQEALCK